MAGKCSTRSIVCSVSILCLVQLQDCQPAKVVSNDAPWLCSFNYGSAKNPSNGSMSEGPVQEPGTSGGHRTRCVHCVLSAARPGLAQETVSTCFRDPNAALGLVACHLELFCKFT